MEESKKVCPFCGAEINASAKKCRFCGNWFDEEIECPYCAEKIKASAKKCRFCGEWIGDKPNEQPSASQKENKKIEIPVTDKRTLVIVSIIGCVLVALALVIGFIYSYVPSCHSKSITTQLEEYMRTKYPTITSIHVLSDKSGVVTKQNRGYSCSAPVTIDDVPSHIDYSYTKVGINNYNFDAKIVLPDCFDPEVKELLGEVIKKSDYLDIKALTSSVTTQYEAMDSEDKKTPTYFCHAQATLLAKPGKAYLLNYWDYDSATRKIKCKVNYKTYFCDNGFTTCVGTTDIYGCENEED